MENGSHFSQNSPQNCNLGIFRGFKIKIWVFFKVIQKNFRRASYHFYIKSAPPSPRESVSTVSFPFCTIPKTENSEMKTSHVLIEHRSFPIPSSVSILYHTQNRKLRDKKPRSLIKGRSIKLRRFLLLSFQLWV